jgi:uncharacterized glyoxalase superfamily protein PhnB
VKITAVLFVDTIEPSLAFWVDRLGFAKTAEVPEGNRLGFVILEKAGAEVMLQTKSSANSDVGQHAATDAKVSLYIEVDDFAETRRRIEGAPVTVPERVAFYGMREIGVQEPGGHYVMFAAREPGT